MQKPTQITFYRTFHDAEPDSLGRRFFTVTWEDPSTWRSELAPDGAPVGHRRGQVFRTDPKAFALGHVVIDVEEISGPGLRLKKGEAGNLAKGSGS